MPAQQPTSTSPPMQSVTWNGIAPSVFVTSPTERGRASHRIHQGRIVTPSSAQVQSSGKQLRYTHPTATAVILPWHDDSSPNASSSTLDVSRPDSGSRLSTPLTIELSREFPGEVNVKKIARDAAVEYHDAKAMVDGLKSPRSSLVQEATKPAHDLEAMPSAIEKDRQAALAALNGSYEVRVANASYTPACLVPGVPQAITTSVGYTAWFESADSLENNAETIANNSSLPATRHTLGYIPYSKLMDRPPTQAGNSARCSLNRKSTQAIRHEQLYASVEGLAEFPNFDASLHQASQVKERKHMTQAAQLKMNDNGFVHFDSQRPSFASVPQYQKRTIDKQEQEALAQEAKRTSRLSAQAAKGDGKRNSFIARLRCSLTK